MFHQQDWITQTQGMDPYHVVWLRLTMIKGIKCRAGHTFICKRLFETLRRAFSVTSHTTPQQEYCASPTTFFNILTVKGSCMMLDITFTPPLCRSIFSEEKMRDVSDPSPSIETCGRFSRVRDCNIKEPCTGMAWRQKQTLYSQTEGCQGQPGERSCRLNLPWSNEIKLALSGHRNTVKHGDGSIMLWELGISSNWKESWRKEEGYTEKQSWVSQPEVGVSVIWLLFSSNE